MSYFIFKNNAVEIPYKYCCIELINFSRLNRDQYIFFDHKVIND